MPDESEARTAVNKRQYFNHSILPANNGALKTLIFPKANKKYVKCEER